MEQLIKITTVPIEYEFKINDAKLERKSGTAELEISRNEGGMQIRSRPVKLRIDSFEASNSVVPTTMRSVEQAAQRGKQSAYEATAQFASEGKMMLRGIMNPGSEVLSQVIAQRNDTTPAQIGLNFIPSTPPEISWEAPEFSIEYQMDKLNFDAKINTGNIEFIPGSIELSITQHPSVSIEYVGDPIYVPPSAAELFGGEVLDTQA